MDLNPRQRRQRVLAAPAATDRSRDLRSHMSLPEVLLWQLLSRRRAGGLMFNRQRPLGPYVADYYCHEALLVVEIDGGQHEGRAEHEHDRERDGWLRRNGHEILRIPARDVLADAAAVAERIVHVAKRRIEALTGRPHESPPKRAVSGGKVIRPRRTRRP